jgi:SAM-dependent methyltransferase
VTFNGQKQMKNFKHLQKVKEVYSKNENIIHFLNKLDESDQNSIDNITISYDFQSGSYIKGIAKNLEYNRVYGGAIAAIFNDLPSVNSILEVGVGEATTLASVIKNMDNRPEHIFGFDISWSRLKFAKNFLSDVKINNVSLFTANLFDIPLNDSSIDVVYTSHSVEPNGGNELAAIKELYRISKHYLVLLEPSFEFANEEARARMKSQGYVTELGKVINDLGLNVIEHRLFEHASNPLNPTGLFIIKKEANSENSNSLELICPFTKAELKHSDDGLLYAEGASLVYPVIQGIPLLLKENAILATHLNTDYDEFKRINNIDLTYY